MLRMTICRSRVFLAAFLTVLTVGPLSTTVSAQAAKPETYTVKKGDTLMSIARQLFGDAARWHDILELNSDQLKDPKLLAVGMVLRVPQAAARPTGAKPTEPKAAEPKAAEPPRREVQTPQPQPQRPPVVIEEPAEAPQEPVEDSLFKPRRGVDAFSALRTYREQPYRPLRPGEFFSAGFLTEGASLPFGQVLGRVTPEQIRNISSRSVATIGITIAVLPPSGAQYAVNDSLLLCETFQGPPGYGDVVVPTGLARVIGQNDGQATATVVSVYGAIRNGQLALPAERFVPGGTSKAQPVEQGVTGKVLGQREHQELNHPHDVLFLSVGRADGVAPGDIFEARRDPRPRPGAADTIDELMATLQVVHVGEHSASAKIINVVSPDIPEGTRVVQVAKLP